MISTDITSLIDTLESHVATDQLTVARFQEAMDQLRGMAEDVRAIELCAVSPAARAVGNAPNVVPFPLRRPS